MVTRAWPWLCGLAGLLAAFPAVCEDGALRANRVVASQTFKAATRSLDDGYSRVVDDIVALTEIPAPPFAERLRAEAFLSRLREAGLGDAAIDAEGNVIGLRPGARATGIDSPVRADCDTKPRPRCAAPAPSTPSSR